MLTNQDFAGLQAVAPFRNQRLFKEFLPTGYKITTLNTVQDKTKIVQLKILLGTLITIYDDYADRPESLNPRLLKMLYRLPFEPVHNANLLSKNEILSLDLVKSLFEKLFQGLQKLDNYEYLQKIFLFDLEQFFLANRYSELLSEYAHLSNRLENRSYLHHNMGIVMAGMIDLMSLPHFDLSELGRARNLFLLGQRAGRISNVITTYERELLEQDNTNELFSFNNCHSNQENCQILVDELNSIYAQMETFRDIKSFSAIRYRDGMQALHRLHTQSKGVI